MKISKGRGEKSARDVPKGSQSSTAPLSMNFKFALYFASPWGVKGGAGVPGGPPNGWTSLTGCMKGAASQTPLKTRGSNDFETEMTRKFVLESAPVFALFPLGASKRDPEPSTPGTKRAAAPASHFCISRTPFGSCRSTP